MTVTSVTRTPKISSTAWRTCVLCAAGRRGTCSGSSSICGSGLLGHDRRQDDVAGALRGRGISLLLLAAARPRLVGGRRVGRRRPRPRARRAPSGSVERGLGDEQRAGPQDGLDARARRPSARRSSAGCGTSSAAASSASSTTTTSGRSSRHLADQRDGVLRARRVERAASKTPIEPRRRAARAPSRRAFRYALRFTLRSYERGCGPNTTPPPRELRGAGRALAGAAGALLAERLGATAGDLAAGLRGVRALPARRPARPSPSRAAATRCGSTPNTASCERRSCPCRRRSGAWSAISGPPARRRASRCAPGTEPDTSSRLRAGSRSTTTRPRWVTRLVAHVAGHAQALPDARGPRGLADRAGLADVVRAVADRAAAEVVALDGAREALALRRAGDLDVVAGAERLDRDGVADDELGRAAELFEMPVRGRRPPSRGGRSPACSGASPWPRRSASWTAS